MIKNPLRGFTLIELMIVVVVIGVLATMSFSIYSTKVIEGRRTDALNTLASISLAEERYRTSHTTYGGLLEVWHNTATSEGGYYSLAISGITETSYTITATAIGDQAKDKADDVTCAILSLGVNQGIVTKSPSACWKQ